uniref:NADH-ubiquinone oxidoreductase chain 4L n=1 Tax=Callochiton steinenii TaxID=2719128 RepID=A0A6H1PGJ1_9MOLL|nr:NADH dehydrogenase subunit 4L [Callochiton steinenii]
MMSFNLPMFNISILLMFLAFLSFCLQRKHLLNVLLCLEMIILSLFMMMVSLMELLSNEGLTVFIFLTMAACEASIGLAMLVVLIRNYGNDYVSSLSTHKC